MADFVALYESYGYEYAGDKSDILDLDEAFMEKRGSCQFLLKLADEELRSELETILWKKYITEGN